MKAKRIPIDCPHCSITHVMHNQALVFQADAAAIRFQERLEPKRAAIPEEAARVIDEELAKLAGLETASSEFNVTRNYLDWLTCLPWGQFSEERLDVEYAKQVCRHPSMTCTGYTRVIATHNI